MTMIGIAGYAEAQVTVTNSQAVSLLDLGFTEDELKKADVAQLTSTTNNYRYWYSGKVPTPSQGHPGYEGVTLFVRGIRSIRNFQLIAESGACSVAITLGTFGRWTD
jgi:hypothetical protein